MSCLSRVPVWVGLTLTSPAQCLEEPKEEKGRQEETNAVLQRGPRETWQAEGCVRASSRRPSTLPGSLLVGPSPSSVLPALLFFILPRWPSPPHLALSLRGLASSAPERCAP